MTTSGERLLCKVKSFVDAKIQESASLRGRVANARPRVAYGKGKKSASLREMLPYGKRNMPSAEKCLLRKENEVDKFMAC